MIVGIVIATVIALSSCTEGKNNTYVDKIATYEVTFLNGDKEDFTIQSLDTGWADEVNGVYLAEGCLKCRIRDNKGIASIGYKTVACNVRSFKLKP